MNRRMTMISTRTIKNEILKIKENLSITYMINKILLIKSNSKTTGYIKIIYQNIIKKEVIKKE